MKNKILFLANSHMSLYKEIEQELDKQGYEVFTILDKSVKFDPFYPGQPIKSIIKKICYKIFDPHKKYWEKQIKLEPMLSQRFDIFFCIEGHSLNKDFVNYLRMNNPLIKCILYLWDSSCYYNYFRHSEYFDRIFTFDRIDAIKHKVSFLPLYWKDHDIQKQENKYLISSIGTNHGDRAFIIKRVIEQLNLLDIKNHYIKIISPIKKFTMVSKVMYHIKLIFYKNNSVKIEEMQLDYNEPKPEYCLTNFIPSNMYYNIMLNSSIILDTDRLGQNGLSSRLIWALSLNKRIITTNSDIQNYPFYNQNQIKIIDRNSPNIPQEIFDNLSDTFNSNNDIMYLRLDNWVKTILTL